MVFNSVVDNNDTPIISICIPTFNRASCLENLFNNLYDIKVMHGNAVEICVSNNQSTDNTAQIIERWCERLSLKVITQSKNIGATLNFNAVIGIATGKWLLGMGDDDSLILSNFTKLIQHLRVADEGDWILNGVANSSGEESLLGTLKSGRYDSQSFKKIILRDGIYRYGFFGMHVFPAYMQPQVMNLSFEQSQPWPHLALFLRHVQKGHVQVFTAPVVQQAGGGEVLFWNINDMAYIKLRKLNIIAETGLVIKDNHWFFDVLLLRELYLARDARTLVFWKAFEPADFNCRALREYFSRYRLLRKPFIYLTWPHCIFLLAIYITPAPVIKFMLYLIGQRKAMHAYYKKKQASEDFDGVKRGL
jgi:glycosyltransferase involved in cell wall biosynthesis